MARGFERYLTAFEAQASAAITADTDSTGTQTDYNKSAGQNLDGCDRAEVEIDVTVAPATACSVKIYIEPLQHDGVGYDSAKFVGSVAVGTTADKYVAEIDVLGEQGRVLIHAVDFALTASVSMRGKYIADA